MQCECSCVQTVYMYRCVGLLVPFSCIVVWESSLSDHFEYCHTICGHDVL